VSFFSRSHWRDIARDFSFEELDTDGERRRARSKRCDLFLCSQTVENPGLQVRGSLLTCSFFFKGSGTLDRAEVSAAFCRRHGAPPPDVLLDAMLARYKNHF
jgi:hypothetical protein